MVTSHSTTTHRRIHRSSSGSDGARPWADRITPDRRLTDRRTGADASIASDIATTGVLPPAIDVERRVDDRRVDLRRATDRRGAPLLRSPVERWAAVVVFAGASAVAGGLSAWLTARGMTWYRRLDLSPLDPPEAVFAPLWSALFTIYAIAGYLAWRATRDPRPTLAWSAALALQTVWAAVFFGAHHSAGGLVVLAALWMAVLAFAVLAHRHDPTATWLMLPYLSWLALATLLNLDIAGAR